MLTHRGVESEPEQRHRPADRRRRGPDEQRRLRSVVEQMADGIVVVGAAGLIRYANPAAEQILGRSRRDLVGTPFGFPSAGDEGAEIDILRPEGGTLAAELRVVDAVWEGETVQLVSIRDVTDRRRGEERARQLQRERTARVEAEASSRARRDLLARMSHELRTPLNAILGYAHLLDLEIGGPLSPEHRHQADRIRTSAEHLLGLIDQVLDLAQLDSERAAVHVAPASAAIAVDAAASVVQPLAESRGITLSIRCPEDSSLTYEGDEDRVRQILINLLTNAATFTEAGGHVSLECGRMTEPDVEARMTGPSIYFRVSDTGIGIPADQLSRIFQPFVQVDSGHTRRSDGTGLGLTIARRFARLMRGDITVRSTVGEGSVFTLWLRAHEEIEPTPHEAERRSAEPTPLTCGLASIGDVLMHELEPFLEAFVARMRSECPTPGVRTLRYSQLAHHLGSYIADLAGLLIALGEAEGGPSSVASDATDIHRLLASRHGAYRARLGWTEEALRCEYGILRGEIERVIRGYDASVEPSAIDEGLTVTGRLLAEAEQASIRALVRTRAPKETREASPAGAESRRVGARSA